MSEQAEPSTASGYCSYCDRWTAKGVVVNEIHSNSGPGAVVVRHAEHIGLRKRDVDQPRTYPG